MSIINLIKKISSEDTSEKSEIRFLRKEQRELIRSISGLISRKKIRSIQEDGYYKVFYKNSDIEKIEKIDEEENFLEISDYLNTLDEIKLILCRSFESCWLAIPDNPKTALSHGIISSRFVYNCDNCNYFDHIVAKITLDNDLIYSEHDFTYDDTHLVEAREEFLKAKEELNDKVNINLSSLHQEAFRLAKDDISFLVQQRIEQEKKNEEERIKQLLETLDGRIRYAFEKTGARYISSTNRRNLVDINWRSKGRRDYRTIVDSASLNVVSAGICLSGTDQVFDLTSLISVVHEGERKGLIVVTR